MNHNFVYQYEKKEHGNCITDRFIISGMLKCERKICVLKSVHRGMAGSHNTNMMVGGNNTIDLALNQC